MIQTLIIKIGTSIRPYDYNLVFAPGSNRILICAIEISNRDVLVMDQSGDVSK